ncbi:MAG: hypothetical protein ACTSVK_18195 [Promethearchaeota archaeon]
MINGEEKSLKEHFRIGMFVASSVIGAGLILLPLKAVEVGLFFLLLMIIIMGVVFFILYNLWINKFKIFFDNNDNSTYPLIDITHEYLGKSGTTLTIFGITISRFMINIVYLILGFNALKSIVSFFTSYEVFEIFIIVGFIFSLIFMIYICLRTIIKKNRFLKKIGKLREFPPIPEHLYKYWTGRNYMVEVDREGLRRYSEYHTTLIIISFWLFSWFSSLLFLQFGNEIFNENILNIFGVIIYYSTGCGLNYFFHYYVDGRQTLVRHPFTHQKMSFRKARLEKVKLGTNLTPFFFGIIMLIIIIIFCLSTLNQNILIENIQNFSFKDPRNFFSILGVIFLAYMSTGIFEIARDSYGKKYMKSALIIGLIITIILYIVFPLISCGVLSPVDLIYASKNNISTPIAISTKIGGYSIILYVAGTLYTLFIVTSASAVGTNTLNNTINYSIKKFVYKNNKPGFSIYTIIITFILIPAAVIIILISNQSISSISSLAGYIGVGTFIIIIPILISIIGIKKNNFIRPPSKKIKTLLILILIILTSVLFFSVYSSLMLSSITEIEWVFIIELILIWILLIFYSIKAAFSRKNKKHLHFI